MLFHVKISLHHLGQVPVNASIPRKRSKKCKQKIIPKYSGFSSDEEITIQNVYSYYYKSVGKCINLISIFLL